MVHETINKSQLKLRHKWMRQRPNQELRTQRRKKVLEILLLTLLIFFAAMQFV